MGKIVTFGEVVMRLSPPDNRKIKQAGHLEFFFGGTEMNVGASLAGFGQRVQHVTNVSDDMIGDAALATMRSYGIDTSWVRRVSQPLGLYFLETGTSIRPSRISYNRLDAAFAHIHPDQVDWEDILKDAIHFHWSGITPGISKSAYLTLKKALEVANKYNLVITADPANRSNLWKYGMKSNQVLKELVSMSTILIGGVTEINHMLDTEFASDKEGFIAASKLLMTECSNLKQVFDKVRIGRSATWQTINSQAWTNEQYLSTSELEISLVRDRLGTGDAFAAGLIYGLQHFGPQEALDFANAACGLKHTIMGDVNLASVEEIQQVASGEVSGRIIR